MRRVEAIRKEESHGKEADGVRKKARIEEKEREKEGKRSSTESLHADVHIPKI